MRSNRTLEDTLSEINEVYIRSCAGHSYSALKNVCTEECLISLLRRPYESSRGVFPKKFREVSWTRISADPTTRVMVYKKSVHYLTVKISRNFRMPVNQDYSEIWTFMITQDNQIKIQSIVLGG